MKQPDTESPRIMIVDDTPQNLQLLEEMLGKRGYVVLSQPSGPMALRAACRHQPDLILLDILMPQMDGFEVCTRLKADSRLKDIPVIFLSALSDPSEKVRAFKAGGVDYIPKPFQIEEIEARVRNHLELYRQKKELQEGYERLQRLERLRDNLVHMIVHDMRSPLTVLQLTLETLGFHIPPGDAEAAALLSGAQAGAGSLAAMVTQVLEVSRLEAGQMPVNRTAGDLAEISRSVLGEFLPLAGRRSLRLTSSGPVRAEFDAHLIRRALANLVHNAIKFTADHGEIRIDVGREGNAACLSVSDNGQGIDPEHHGRIFEKFGQAPDPKNRTGTGLGLAFCRLAAEAHGGRIGVTSAKGSGSTFSLTIPCLP